VLFSLLPFLGWLEIHGDAVPWSAATSGLVALLAFHALIERRGTAAGPPAYGLTAVVLAFVAVACAQAFVVATRRTITPRNTRNTRFIQRLLHQR